MKTIGYAIAGLGLLLAGCATQFFPGELITVELRGAKASPVAAESGHRSIGEAEALGMLSAEEKQLLSAIRVTEKAQGFSSASWSVDEGVLRYTSFRLGKTGEQGTQVWLKVDWQRHTIQLFSSEKTDRVAVVADSLSRDIHQTGLDANVTKTENSVPVRPGVFGS